MIVIKVIPHSEQRYETIGDWWIDGEDWHIRVSELGDWKMEQAIAIHELVELSLCHARGITQKEVDEFDIEFEKNRKDDSEPGDSPLSPYKKEHFSATNIERYFIELHGIDWSEYENKCLNYGTTDTSTK